MCATLPSVSAFLKHGFKVEFGGPTHGYTVIDSEGRVVLYGMEKEGMFEVSKDKTFLASCFVDHQRLGHQNGQAHQYGYWRESEFIIEHQFK